MKNNRILALIIAFYLSKFDRVALKNLGFKNFTEAFERIGSILDVKPNTIKNMREEYDPIHPNRRVGWYQSEMSPSRLGVLNKYDHLSELALTEIVKDILNNFDSNNNNIDLYTSVIKNKDEKNDNNDNNYTYSTRGITGHKAEELFFKAFNKGKIKGFTGKLIDTRFDGTGYDFKLDSKEKEKVFEVKGLRGELGGVMFTDKEWQVASRLKENYILVLVSNVENNPEFTFIRNPYEKLSPKRVTSTTIAINWTISSNQLSEW